MLQTSVYVLTKLWLPRAYTGEEAWRLEFIGLGNMGLPMASNLLRKGFELQVYARTRSKAEALGASSPW